MSDRDSDEKYESDSDAAFAKPHGASESEFELVPDKDPGLFIVDVAAELPEFEVVPDAKRTTAAKATKDPVLLVSDLRWPWNDEVADQIESATRAAEARGASILKGLRFVKSPEPLPDSVWPRLRARIAVLLAANPIATWGDLHDATVDDQLAALAEFLAQCAVDNQFIPAAQKDVYRSGLLAKATWLPLGADTHHPMVGLLDWLHGHDGPIRFARRDQACAFAGLGLSVDAAYGSPGTAAWWTERGAADNFRRTVREWIRSVPSPALRMQIADYAIRAANRAALDADPRRAQCRRSVTSLVVAPPARVPAIPLPGDVVAHLRDLAAFTPGESEAPRRDAADESEIGEICRLGRQFNCVMSAAYYAQHVASFDSLARKVRLAFDTLEGAILPVAPGARDIPDQIVAAYRRLVDGLRYSLTDPASVPGGRPPDLSADTRSLLQGKRLDASTMRRLVDKCADVLRRMEKTAAQVDNIREAVDVFLNHDAGAYASAVGSTVESLCRLCDQLPDSLCSGSKQPDLDGLSHANRLIVDALVHFNQAAAKRLREQP